MLADLPGFLSLIRDLLGLSMAYIVYIKLLVLHCDGHLVIVPIANEVVIPQFLVSFGTIQLTYHLLPTLFKCERKYTLNFKYILILTDPYQPQHVLQREWRIHLLPQLNRGWKAYPRLYWYGRLLLLLSSLLRRKWSSILGRYFRPIEVRPVQRNILKVFINTHYRPLSFDKLRDIDVTIFTANDIFSEAPGDVRGPRDAEDQPRCLS